MVCRRARRPPVEDFGGRDTRVPMQEIPSRGHSPMGWNYPDSFKTTGPGKVTQLGGGRIILTPVAAQESM